jgi:hypothetical protein
MVTLTGAAVLGLWTSSPLRTPAPRSPTLVLLPDAVTMLVLLRLVAQVAGGTAHQVRPAMVSSLLFLCFSATNCYGVGRARFLGLGVQIDRNKFVEQIT